MVDFEKIQSILEGNYLYRTTAEKHTYIPKIPKFRKKIQRPLLMPRNWDDFIGQKNVKTLIHNAIVASKKLDKPFPHTLLLGNPGVGKTTIAFLIADSLSTNIVPIQGAMIEKPEDLYAIFSELSEGRYPILFIDEIHSINKKLSEILYLSLDMPGTVINFKIWGNIQQSIKIPVYSLIACTAGEEGKLKKPLLDRLGLKLYLEQYTTDEIAKIIYNSAKKLEMHLQDDLIYEIAKRSCFTPRIANNLLLRFQEYLIANEVKPSKEHLLKLFELLQIDELGLSKTSRKILEILAELDGFCGLKTLASMLCIDETSLQAYELPLANLGLITFTKRGRAITKKGLEILYKNRKIQEDDH